MKKISLLLSIIVLSHSLLPVKAASSLIEAIQENNQRVNIFEKMANLVASLPVSPIVGSIKGVQHKTSSIVSDVKYADINIVSKSMIMPFAASYGVVAGFVTGLLKGASNSFEYSFKEEFLSKHALSL